MFTISILRGQIRIVKASAEFFIIIAYIFERNTISNMFHIVQNLEKPHIGY